MERISKPEYIQGWLESLDNTTDTPHQHFASCLEKKRIKSSSRLRQFHKQQQPNLSTQSNMESNNRHNLRPRPRVIYTEQQSRTARQGKPLSKALLPTAPTRGTKRRRTNEETEFPDEVAGYSTFATSAKSSRRQLLMLKYAQSSVKNLFQQRYPMEAAVSELDRGEQAVPTAQGQELFRAINTAYRLADEAFQDLGDEDTWSISASEILKRFISTDETVPSFLSVVPVHNISIAPSDLMPKVDHLIPFKKVDYLISFSSKHGDVGPLTSAALKSQRDLSLSQTLDPRVGSTPHFVAVEVKTPDGAYLPSSVQLVTWMAAGLEKVRQLKEEAEQISKEPEQGDILLPFIGISVTGHIWNLLITAKAEDGTVTMYGPIIMGDTLTFEGVFRLFMVIDEIKSWGENVYWPWMKGRILEPLANIEAIQQEDVASASGDRDS
ncbi:predicted protein [Uncinocarpus reesii 1704]|uniref:PD-(D/E)XK nuclease-like domain-containing protein n=1 Tax=Uncinocarpus reesii (strain UAMH 1704) TaxID=336963 RepID=C4JQQ5_UNCRE|nr:uncharacterized protein UREG_03400 [Uncinocarpus reesii 1704]EEP78554.1 predicted protein [Uncinocarpus reesii 1704]